jgi:hypothetical protein
MTLETIETIARVAAENIRRVQLGLAPEWMMASG